MKLNKRILYNLLPGLLPLFIFILADEIWGTVTGLYVAIGFGIIELFFTYIKSGKFEKFILIDIGLLVILGGVSILLENDIFFKLKPAFIEIIFAMILGVSVFGKKNFIYEMSLRYMKGIQLSPLAERKLSKSLRVLLYITLVHILAVCYSSFYMSDKAWAFISGGLFYIIVLVYFGFEMIRERFKKRDMDGEEYLPVVDEKGNITNKAKRSECHFNSKERLLHPVVHMHIFNPAGEIFLQHRPKNKEVQPDKWDVAVGGHISYGESIEEALRRETREEVGLTEFKPQFIQQYIWETEVEKEMVFTFICLTDKKMNINHNEVSEGRFWKVSEIKKITGKNKLTPNFEKEFKILTDKGIIRN